jgi:hypothetical protein
MELKFCSCRMCRYGRKKFGNHEMIRRMRRNYRHKVKTLLKKFPEKWEELPVAISILYTD